MPRTTKEANQLIRRQIRTRAKIATNTAIPRLSVHRSLRGMYAQIIDDAAGKTLVATSDKSLKLTGTKTSRAEAVGNEIAKLATAKKITAVRFDRGARKYHGRIAALAEAARKGGLKF
jgi:large subunit ribosomal protein L18